MAALRAAARNLNQPLSRPLKKVRPPLSSKVRLLRLLLAGSNLLGKEQLPICRLWRHLEQGLILYGQAANFPRQRHLKGRCNGLLLGLRHLSLELLAPPGDL
jgi:hypothetical protein